MNWSIEANPPRGNDRRVKLCARDWIFSGIDNVFVYPQLDLEKLRNALSRTLSDWPLLTGRLILDKNEYFIQCCDQSIPFTYVENDEMNEWPNLPVVLADDATLQPFIDSIRARVEVEPLLRFKVTRLIHSEEFILGVSFSHLVGDAHSNLHFLNDLSRIYQNLAPNLPRPIFERNYLQEENLALAKSPVMKHFRTAEKKEVILARLKAEEAETDPVNLSFSSEHIETLQNLAGGSAEVSKHDGLCAYLIFSLNKYFFADQSNEKVRRIHLLINFRGIDEELSPEGQVMNAIFQMLTEDFSPCSSLKIIAKTIRQSIEKSREKEFFRQWFLTSEFLWRQINEEGKKNFLWDKDEMIINSNYKYDWTDQVDFGHENQCRFHTAGLFRFYSRIFRLNPRRNDDGKWIKDRNGAEIALRIPRGERKEIFLQSVYKDFNDNFSSLITND